ncbi:MAG TPA: glutaredoxin family protein [Opitutaceae bacterium]|nr:glutaredoxin family protein [Opitutaceae bacterium]
MAADPLPILYVKTGCPWCQEVISFLMTYGIEYREKNVNEDRQAFEEMKRKSGQTLAPTLDWRGKILADFGVKELRPFLIEQNVRFEDS